MNHEALLAKTLGDDEQEKLAAHFDSYTTDELAVLLKTSGVGVGVSVPIYTPHQLRMQEIVKSRQREAMRPEERKFYDKSTEHTKSRAQHAGAGAAGGALAGGALGAYLGKSRPAWGGVGGGITGAAGGALAGALGGAAVHRLRAGAAPKLSDFKKESGISKEKMEKVRQSTGFLSDRSADARTYLNSRIDAKQYGHDAAARLSRRAKPSGAGNQNWALIEMLGGDRMRRLSKRTLTRAGKTVLSGVEIVDDVGRMLAHSDIEKVSAGGIASLAPKVPGLNGSGVGSVGGAPKITMPTPGGGGGVAKVGSAKLRAEMDKVAFMGAGMIASGINKAAPMLQKATRGLANASWGKAGGYGAAAGAALGAGRHLLSKRDPQTGQKNTSLLGSMAGGAALGGAAGAGLKAGAGRFQGTGLHKRMTSGNFQFGGPQPQQGSLNLGGGPAGGPMPGATPAAQPPGVMARIKSMFTNSGAQPRPAAPNAPLPGMPA